MSNLKSTRIVKWLASAALIATTAGVLGGCYVEPRRPVYYHHYYRPIVVVR